MEASQHTVATLVQDCCKEGSGVGTVEFNTPEEWDKARSFIDQQAFPFTCQAPVSVCTFMSCSFAACLSLQARACIFIWVLAFPDVG